jgi:hypothetical protein
MAGSASLLSDANEPETNQPGFDPQGMSMSMGHGTLPDSGGHQVTPPPPPSPSAPGASYPQWFIWSPLAGQAVLSSQITPGR